MANISKYIFGNTEIEPMDFGIQHIARPFEPENDDDRKGYYKSQGEFGWKLLELGRFTILYIPKDTYCHIGGLYLESVSSRKEDEKNKMRASCAYVCSIWSVLCTERPTADGSFIHSFRVYDCVPEKFGVSCFDTNYVYHPDVLVVPKDGFSMPHEVGDEECARGIHYYSRPLSPNRNNCVYMYSKTAIQAIQRCYETQVQMLQQDTERLELRCKELMGGNANE